MASGTVIALIKFFSEERYADLFMAGKLHLNTLRYFRELEAADDEDDDGRADLTEAVWHWWQPEDIVLNLHVERIGSVTITKEDLAAPVSTSLGYHDYLHLYCMYAVRIYGFEYKDGKFACERERVDELQGQLAIDERCLKFGPVSVIVSGAAFKHRLEQALIARGQQARSRLVQYYDESTFHGSFAEIDVPFMKQQRFSYQHEYRLCVNTGEQVNKPMALDIGDISSLCSKMKSTDLQRWLELKENSPKPG